MDAFTEQNVTQDVLPELSDNNLRELGLNIGWRLSFRRAVSTELPRGDCFADSTPLGFNNLLQGAAHLGREEGPTHG